MQCNVIRTVILFVGLVRIFILKNNHILDQLNDAHGHVLYTWYLLILAFSSK